MKKSKQFVQLVITVLLVVLFRSHVLKEHSETILKVWIQLIAVNAQLVLTVQALE